jgi:hypothetical protein
MKIGSYQDRIDVLLSTDEFVQLGRPDAIDVTLVTNGSGFIEVRKGTKYRGFALDAGLLGREIAFFTSLPRFSSAPVFARQNVLSTKRGDTLVSGKPDFTKAPMVRRKRTASAARDEQVIEGKPRMVPLEDAVFSINAHKRARPGDIVLTVDDKGFLDVLLRLGR